MSIVVVVEVAGWIARGDLSSDIPQLDINMTVKVHAEMIAVLIRARRFVRNLMQTPREPPVFVQLGPVQ